MMRPAKRRDNLILRVLNSPAANGLVPGGSE